jgi:hypothetical protein
LVHEVRFHRYLLLPASAPPPLRGYAPAPAREAQHVLSRAVASGEASTLLAFWSARTGMPLVGGATARSLRRALEWACSSLERTVGGLILWRRETPRIEGELRLRGLPEPTAPPKAPADKRDFIEFELLDKHGEPVRGLPFAVTKGEETLLAGKLNRFANVFLDRIDPGSYTFALTAEPPPAPPEPSEWLSLELLSEGGRPLAGEAFRLVDAAGKVHEGKADDGGRVVLYGVAPGDCELSLPGLLPAKK